MRLITLGGLLALLAGVIVAGAQADHRQLGSNLVASSAFVAVLEGGQRLCQATERVPPGTSAVRLTIGTYGRPGPPLGLRVAGARGGLAAGWRQGTVVVPLTGTIAREDPSARVCLRNAGEARIAVAGAPFAEDVGLRIGPTRVGARIRVEYTTTERRSWWSLAAPIADRMYAVRAAVPGPATPWLWAGLLGAVVLGVAALVLLGLPRLGHAVALLALVNALAWGLVIPPWHVPDETSHFYYAGYLAQTGDVPAPTPESFWYSQKMNDILTTAAFPQVAGREYNRPPWTDAAREAADAQERSEVDEVGRGDASTATTNSPVYYVLQAAAYELSPSGALLDRLMFMRLVSAILSALTVACIFAFLRELVPGSTWAAAAGALAAGLQPLFGFVSSGVNNDGALYLCSALVLLGMARAFRRGLTPRRAALVGGALALGTLVKVQLVAFAPAVALALVLLLLRDRGHIGRRALAAGALAVGVPLLAYYVLGQTIWQRPVLDRVGALTASTGQSPELTGLVSYVWQTYLPRPPFLFDWFPGYALRNLWADGLIGRFGWLDYGFPRWVYPVGYVAFGLVAAGAAATLYRRRAALRARAGEAAVYAAAAVGLATVVAVAGYLNRLQSGQFFEQARYVLPLLPLYGAAVALAVQALGRRRAPALAAAVIVVALAHDVFAQLVTVARYYG